MLLNDQISFFNHFMKLLYCFFIYFYLLNLRISDLFSLMRDQIESILDLHDPAEHSTVIGIRHLNYIRGY